jgi:DegV family protein with EDD domain
VTSGVKAFNRIAALRSGAFTLTLETFEGEQTVSSDLATLVTDALDEKFQLDEVLAGLPSLEVTLQLKMVEQFFQIEFSPLEREVLTQVQAGVTLGQLLDRIQATDLEVARVVQDLHQRGIVTFSEPEHRVVVLTDSTSDLRPAIARRQGIRIIPLSVLFGRQVYRDGVDLQPDDFYAKLTASDQLPTTSPPSKGEFLEHYQRLVGAADVLSIHISAKQSKTLEFAGQAAEEGHEEFERLRSEEGQQGPVRIRLVDSWFNSIGLGMLAVFAARMLRRGLELDEVADRLEDIRGRCQMLFVVNTLEYLQKGGRIGKAQALLGSLLGIKPILGMVDGEVVPVDKVRGGRKVQTRLVEILGERLSADQPIIAGMAHAIAPKWAGRLHQLIEERFQVAEVFQAAIGPVVGTHVGPGCVGTSVFQPTAEELELLGPAADADLSEKL